MNELSGYELFVIAIIYQRPVTAVLFVRIVASQIEFQCGLCRCGKKSQEIGNNYIGIRIAPYRSTQAVDPRRQGRQG